MKPPRLFCFGLGYSALTWAMRLKKQGWGVSGTCQSESRLAELQNLGFEALLFDGHDASQIPASALNGVTHVLLSIPPDENGDLVFATCRSMLENLKSLKWFGYLSTTGVYGNRNGGKVDENSVLNPTSKRSQWRMDAEQQWLSLYKQSNFPVHIFRLSGIYGAARSALERVARGKASRIDKPGHLFSRIHVDDIANTLMASTMKPRPGGVYNVCDDSPQQNRTVIEFACQLLNKPLPLLVNYDEAAKTMSSMARSFWLDNRLVDNSLIKSELGVVLEHPDYKAGLRSIFDQMEVSR